MELLRIHYGIRYYVLHFFANNDYFRFYTKWVLY